MPSLTPYRMMRYQDAAALREWRGVHLQRHLSEQRAFSLTGVALPSPQLDGPLDASWFGAHWTLHQGMQSAASPSSSYSIASLATPWGDARSFYDWMHLHTLVHARVDQTLGIS